MRGKTVLCYQKKLAGSLFNIVEALTLRKMFGGRVALATGLGLWLAAGLLLSGCGPTSGGPSCTERCGNDFNACVECCELLKGTMQQDCMITCECSRTCCLEGQCGQGPEGRCAACQVEDPDQACDPVQAQDADRDGYNTYDGDCDDADPNINPGVREVSNGIDDNCDGKIDADLDGDGFATEEGDCNDNDPAVHPFASEVCNDHIDNDCNGYTDQEEPDKDLDGYGPCAGDCDDSEPMIGPGSIEDPTDEVDNDCDGLVDESREPCDCGGSPTAVEALDICNPNVVLDVTPYGDARGRGVFTSWGAIVPRTTTTHPTVEKLMAQDCGFLILCCGPAADPNPQPGQPFETTDQDPLGNPESANDLVQLAIQFQVPRNAEGFSFDFIYLSSEYPEWVCTQFNDTFYAIEVSSSLNGGQPTNISFDHNNNEITVNNNFLEDPNSWTQDLTGTGYDVSDGDAYCNGDPNSFPGCNMPNPCPPPNNTIGSATGWLRTTAPVTPGEVMTLTFSIHDEGDYILDSCVVIDNFQWVTTPVEGPGTVK